MIQQVRFGLRKEPLLNFCDFGDAQGSRCHEILQAGAGAGLPAGELSSEPVQRFRILDQDLLPSVFPGHTDS